MLDRDRVKYVEVIQSKSDNGKKGGRPKKEAKKANALFDKLKKLDKATQADSVSVPDSDSVPDIDTYETDIPKGIWSQAIVAIEKIDKRNTGTQRILEIVQSEVEGNGFIYEKHRDDRYRATIIAKRQSEWGSFIGDSSEESEEKAIRSIISFSNQNEFVKRIRNVYDFHEKWKSVANSMKLQNKENIKNAPNPDPLLRF